jgi:hypothetical protein
MSNESVSLCPTCGKHLFFRDYRKRICKDFQGSTEFIYIRRLKCGCGKLHNELPDLLVPYKHYRNEVIENVLDDVSTPNDPTSEDYPCESTMKRWKNWLKANVNQIAGSLKAISYLVLDSSEALLKSKTSLFTPIRASGAGWLSIIHKYIYNSGYALHL